MSFTGEKGPGPTSVAAPNLKKYWVPLDRPWTSILVMVPAEELCIVSVVNKGIYGYSLMFWWVGRESRGDSHHPERAFPTSHPAG